MLLVIFGGDDASRAVLLFRCQVKMLCICASMEQKDSYASVAYARLVCWLRLFFLLPGQDAWHLGRYVSEGQLCVCGICTAGFVG